MKTWDYIRNFRSKHCLTKIHKLPCGLNAGRIFCLLQESGPSNPSILNTIEPSTFSLSGSDNTKHRPLENEQQVDPIDHPDVLFNNPIELFKDTEIQGDHFNVNTDDNAGDEEQLSKPDTFSAEKKCNHSFATYKV